MPTRTLIVLLTPLALFAQSEASSPGQADLAKQVTDLSAVIQKLQHRVDELEARLGSPAAAERTENPKDVRSAQAALPASEQTTPGAPAVSNFLSGTSVNFLLDGYYGYNFNNPIGRVNRLRAYDVLSNAFSLNQADVVFENAPDLEKDKRWGLRLDLQFGQATETLQGNAANEPRPNVYRNVFQAYGTYIVPIGSGLTVDFGKFASSLGIESNFTQDGMNYSRSYWFDFLPFYHMGLRMNYPLSKAVTINYWVTNGTQQTEPYNGFKDQFIGLGIQPRKNFSWNVNYYFGQEHPDVTYLPNSTDPTLPTIQGQTFVPVVPAPRGKLHIFDSYFTWQATPKWTFALDSDYVIQRLYTNSAPAETWGGTVYARYRFSPRWAVAGRSEYLADHGGMFSGATQALKEATLTVEQKVIEGLLIREEWRRDFSNQPYFYTNLLGVLKREQNTATVGVVWWFGAKKSLW